MGVSWLRHLDVIFCSLYPILQELGNIGKRTSSGTFAVMLYGYIRRNPAKFFNVLFAFNIVGSVIMLAKNVKQNWDQMREKVQFLQHLSPR